MSINISKNSGWLYCLILRSEGGALLSPADAIIGRNSHSHRHPAKILAAICFRGAGGVIGTLIARLSVNIFLNGVVGVTIARRMASGDQMFPWLWLLILGVWERSKDGGMIMDVCVDDNARNSCSLAD